MEYCTLGKTKEKIPVLGLGTWQLGRQERTKEIEAIRKGIELGMNFVDTAEMYNTEDIVAEAISGIKNVFVATKVSPQHFNHDSVISSCNASLKRLGIKTIDLYQLHWPNPGVDIKETMTAMEKLVDDGKIRHIGVSNFSVKDLKEAQEAMKKHEIVSNQIEYSIVVRDNEPEITDYCKENGITVIAYSPLGHGDLYLKKYSALLGLLTEIGKKYGKSPTQVALNWLIAKGNVSAIPKASTNEHVTDNAGSVNWRLKPRDQERLDAELLKYNKMPIAKIVRPLIGPYSFIKKMTEKKHD